MKVALATPPKLARKPGRKRNGPCTPISTPFRLPPLALPIDEIVQSWPSGFDAAGELPRMTDVGSPVEANVPVRVRLSGKLAIFFLKPAIDSTDSLAKYHSAPMSN